MQSGNLAQKRSVRRVSFLEWVYSRFDEAKKEVCFFNVKTDTPVWHFGVETTYVIEYTRSIFEMCLYLLCFYQII